MTIFDGKFLKGIMGDFIFKVVDGVHVVSKKTVSGTMEQSVEIKKASENFRKSRNNNRYQMVHVGYNEKFAKKISKLPVRSQIDQRKKIGLITSLGAISDVVSKGYQSGNKILGILYSIILEMRVV